MSTDEHQDSIDHLREELSAMILDQVKDLHEQIDRMRTDLQILKERNERLESHARRH